ncbi:Uncharacterized conserved protein [Octadecabacter temperatus]|uniref:Glutathione-dependent formaldehyde-activating enzyme n=1 Tax=Octadecabacter temperatus TaxID=1458307 RepID=A0A0K0Y1G7_9RHOB|nr:GFA family protein [Octadecabacter temperatus]AKS44742.1 Glutathione-dependent formaldehyde-activating enzyme [Octadecabacter temperatus]SIO35788.1 Uncharacterized conserved protein [Octadecabacter temperatus]
MKSGRCLCGGVHFEYESEELFCGHCHCASCRRQTASPFTTFLGVANGTWRWKGETPKVYESSPGQKRYFCGTCGAPVAYSSARWPDEIHFYAALLDDPGSFTPNEHYHWEERLHWAAPTDDLPKNEGTISELGGEGTTN